MAVKEQLSDGSRLRALSTRKLGDIVLTGSESPDIVRDPDTVTTFEPLSESEARTRLMILAHANNRN